MGGETGEITSDGKTSAGWSEDFSFQKYKPFVFHFNLD